MELQVYMIDEINRNIDTMKRMILLNNKNINQLKKYLVEKEFESALNTLIHNNNTEPLQKQFDIVMKKAYENDYEWNSTVSRMIIYADNIVGLLHRRNKINDVIMEIGKFKPHNFDKQY